MDFLNTDDVMEESGYSWSSLQTTDSYCWTTSTWVSELAVVEDTLA